MKVYVTGSLRNPNVPQVAKGLRGLFPEHEFFDDWFASGPTADDEWKAYELGRGRDYIQALQGHAANHVFGYDKGHLDSSDAVVLVTPCGKSSYLELGYALGAGKLGIIYLDPESAKDRWDVMVKFAQVATNESDVALALIRYEDDQRRKR